MPDRKGAWIGVSLIAGTMLVLAGPVYLLWNVYHARPWDSHTVRVRFEGVRYEGLGYIFTYRLDNRTHRSLRLRPDRIQVKALREGSGPAPRFVGLVTPIDLEAGGSQEIELRFEPPMRSGTFGLAPPVIKAESPPPIGGPEPPVSPLPMRDPPHEAEPQVPEFSLRQPLEDLKGFEIINERTGLRLVLPRAW